jgi:hypothetical protein
MARRRSDRKPFIEHNAPWGFVLLGLAMIVTAAVDYLPQALAITFVILGAGLVVLGGVLPTLEGSLELGPRGLKEQIQERKAELLEAATDVAPERVEALRSLADFLDPTTPLYWGVRSPEYRRKLDRELVRVWLSDAWARAPADRVPARTGRPSDAEARTASRSPERR